MYRHVSGSLRYAADLFDMHAGWFFTNGRKDPNRCAERMAMHIVRRCNDEVEYLHVGSHTDLQKALEVVLMEDPKLRTTVYEALMTVCRAQVDEDKAEALVNELTKDLLRA